MAAGGRSLDFIVIGAQKAGTTTLWWHLRHHPAIWMPERKEEPFFCCSESARPGAFEDYMHTHFGEADTEALLGKATPQYMMGTEQSGIGEIARRISATLPEVRLIALLRDPIDRAVSHYRMSVRRGWEERSLDAVLDEQLDREHLITAREHPTETNSYVVQGEYGRVLRAYREYFPAERIHVELTADLAHDPEGALDRVLSFLSLPEDFRPPRLDARLHRGGTRALLDAESRASLLEFMEENIWPKLGEERESVQRLFHAFLAIWDVSPGEAPPSPSAAIRSRLVSHYEGDADALAELGVNASWLASWRDDDLPTAQ
jgi:hypothetical protein